MPHNTGMMKHVQQLLVPKNLDAVLVRLESGDLRCTGRDRDWLTEVVGALAGPSGKVIQKTHYLFGSGTFVDGTVDGEVVIQKRPDGRFKLIPHGHTSGELLNRCALLLAHPDSITMEHNHGKEIARGRLKSAGAEPAKAQPNNDAPIRLADVPRTLDIVARNGHASSVTAVVAADAVGPEAAKEKLGQKLIMTFLENGQKVRMIGKQSECEAMAKKIVGGSPSLAAPKGGKYQIEGNLKRSFNEKASGTAAPDANNVRTRDDPPGRTFSAFGDNLTAVEAAAKANCKEGTVVTVVIGNRILSAGTRLQK